MGMNLCLRMSQLILKSQQADGIYILIYSHRIEITYIQIENSSQFN